ncbi:type II toxin-antitoxin system RelE/ParE family toxin [Alcaligenaceae bacterium]|nr:type II toxin-antitoxin system RelE/ParE family toxin [Alcaligenaceae bacterium]
MKALFVELPAFERYRKQYMDDDTLHTFQTELIKNPEAGDVIAGTGGLRKVRHGDPRRGKGKRGGLRIIYYWWSGGQQFWLFTLYDKDEMNDLSTKERQALANMLRDEIQARAT